MDHSAGLHPDMTADRQPDRRNAVEEIDLELLHGCRRLTTRHRTNADIRNGGYDARVGGGVEPA
jgi:hypothetical protein